MNVLRGAMKELWIDGYNEGARAGVKMVHQAVRDIEETTGTISRAQLEILLTTMMSQLGPSVAVPADAPTEEPVATVLRLVPGGGGE